MKKSTLTMQNAFTFLLQGLYFTETRLATELGSCSRQSTSARLSDEVKNYAESTQYKLLKLERIFSYLLNTSNSRKNEVIDKLLTETHAILNTADPGHLKDILMIGCIQNINAYKITSYRTACLLAVELELDTVADLLQQIIGWETETSRILAALSSEQFCGLAGESTTK